MDTENKCMNRRSFLKTAGAGGASLAISPAIAGEVLASDTANNNSNNKMPTRPLGRSGIQVPILGLGGALDLTTNQTLLRMCFNMGVTYLDTADGYANGNSEIGIGQYFSKYPEDRKKVFIATKAMNKYDPKEISDSIDSSLKNMNTDYIDLFHYFNINTPDMFTPEIRKLAEQKKKEGKIRLFGLSSHLFNGDQFLSQVAEAGWFDAVMVVVNYLQLQKDEIRRGLDDLTGAGVGIIAMKTQVKNVNTVETAEHLKALEHFMAKGYTLEQAKLKAVWNDERVATACSNITSMAILKDNVAAATDNVGLSSGDLRMLKMLADATRSSYCPGCGRCVAVMGAESRIPDVMRYMMYYHGYGERDRARSLFRELPADLRDNLAARDYSPAESACPHRIQIGKVMREATLLLA
ncbi:MAG: aldo/keto reductase [Deltaproteobacteria bacterium]|nr:aldo/keto reductase [Deltaproteobacteria bacterium]